jgi:hypothetical protein
MKNEKARESQKQFLFPFPRQSQTGDHAPLDENESEKNIFISLTNAPPDKCQRQFRIFTPAREQETTP